MLQSLPMRKLSTILELLDTNEAERLHMERGQLAQYRSHSGFVGAMPCIALRSITAWQGDARRRPYQQCTLNEWYWASRPRFHDAPSSVKSPNALIFRSSSLQSNTKKQRIWSSRRCFWFWWMAPIACSWCSAAVGAGTCFHRRSTRRNSGIGGGSLNLHKESRR